MNRREKFERAYAELHDMPHVTFEQYRMGDTYRLPMIAKCWRFWNQALDSVEIDLSDCDAQLFDGGSYYHQVKVDKAIEAAGVRIKE